VCIARSKDARKRLFSEGERSRAKNLSRATALDASLRVAFHLRENYPKTVTQDV